MKLSFFFQTLNYCPGGLLGETVLSSCEIYNVKTDKWKEIDDVPQGTDNVALVIFISQLCSIHL